jgi:hypothetical protein
MKIRVMAAWDVRQKGQIAFIKATSTYISQIVKRKPVNAMPKIIRVPFCLKNEFRFSKYSTARIAR